MYTNKIPVIKISFGPWGSMYVCFLMLLSSFLQHISVSVNNNGGPNMKNNPGNIISILLVHCVSSALPIGGGGHGCVNILAHPNVPCMHL
jgi:hypothetical protein